MIQSLSPSPRHRIGRPLTVNASSSSYPHQHSTADSRPDISRTHYPNTTINISSSISLLPQHPPMPHSSLTFLPLLIHPIHSPRPCAPKAGPRHKPQYIPRPRRPITPISTSCPSSIRPRTTHPKTNPSIRLNRLSKSPV